MGLSLLPANVAWKQEYTCLSGACTHTHTHTHTISQTVFKILILVFSLLCLTLKNMCVLTLSYMTLWDPMNCSLPGCSVMKFSRWEYWNVLLFPSPKDLPYTLQGLNPPLLTLLHWQVDSLSMNHLGSPKYEPRVKNQMWKTKAK